MFFLMSCDNHVRRKNEITKIEIATGSCFGPCQSTVTIIDSSLTYKYFGGDTYFGLMQNNHNNNKLRGYYSSTISQGFWDTINIKLENINYKHLGTSYQHSVDDQSLEVFIYYGNKIKHIKAQSGSLPDSVGHVFYYLINSYKVIKPRPTKNTFNFNSTIHKALPMPDVHNIKFPPPVVR